ncbi:oligosaccharide flippase family protein [Arthrobacter sp. BE255]|uniref:lipopolysaccharide biosynthesis protein n=1 Tax=Arthrobacter sp. BE255 TaxID=2817721 RepID=UPI00286020A3|nr:oligosaccharide flippase family protein [Arthrobacter sp. BE255]MDR7160109.1 O-antigen/teichoic acid export membrane protein [Arthrobacter sp. BE255]
MKRLSGGWLISSSGSQAVNAIAGMLTNVVYARSLRLDEVGLIALVNAIGMFSTVFVDRGIGAWMTRALAAGEISFLNTMEIVFKAARPALAGFALAGATVFVLSPTLPPGWSATCVYSILFIACFWIFQVGLSFTQGLNLAGLRSIGVVLNGVLTLGCTALALGVGGGLSGALSATLAAYLAVGLLLIGASAMSSNKPIPRQRRIPPRRALRASRALFASNIVTYAVSSGDILLASLLFAPSQIGQYQIAKKVAQATVLPLIATLPMMLGRISARNEENRREFVSRFIRFSAIGFSALLLVGSLILPFAMPWLFGNEYDGVTLLTLVLACSYQFQFLRDLLSVYSNSRGLYTRSLIVNVLTALTFLALVAALSTVINLVLFAFTMMLSFVIGFAAHMFLLHRKDMWERKRVNRLVTSTCGLIVCLIGIQALPWIFNTWRTI